MPVNIRWMQQRDVPQVVSIYNATFCPEQWTDKTLLMLMQQRELIGYVATHPRTDRALGFMIYELHQSRLHLLTIAVSGKWRRAGIGRRLIEKLQFKCVDHRRPRLTLFVPDRLLEAQLFFRACGFKAVRVIHDLDPESMDCTYCFEWLVSKSVGVI